jgi:hypothetical protein
MANYAKVTDGVVTQVIVADASFIQGYKDSSPGKWVVAPDDNSVGIGNAYDEKTQQFSIPKALSVRHISYPPIQDQLLAIWASMDSGEIPVSKAFYDLIKEVNDKYPVTF